MLQQKSLITLTLAALLLVGTGAFAQSTTPPEINGARDGSILGGPAPGPLAPGDFLIDEDFADITNLPDWFVQNNSDPLGLTDWFQGNPTVFPAHAGAPDAYIGANFNNSGSPGTISNWLITPLLDCTIVDTFAFWTRGPAGSIFPDRLELRLANSDSTNVGAGAMDVGDFTELLIEINPALAVGGYPEAWTEFVFANAGAYAGDCRFALRYYVTDAGPAGANSDYIGIDTVQVVEGEPVPTTTTIGLAMLVLMLAFVSVIAIRRRIV